MDTEILKLDTPYEYIFCNGELGKHVATYIVGETRKNEDGKYELETHSHPIVKYWHMPQGVVWNKAELTDCEVLCDDTDKRVDAFKFCLLCNKLADMKNLEDEAKGNYGSSHWPQDEALPLREKLRQWGIGFKSSGFPDNVEDILLEVSKSSQGYFVQPLYPDCLLYFNFTERTLEELAEKVKEEKEYQEDFFGHVLTIRFSAETDLAKKFIDML